jgi:hypothetical protein
MAPEGSKKISIDIPSRMARPQRPQYESEPIDRAIITKLSEQTNTIDIIIFIIITAIQCSSVITSDQITLLKQQRTDINTKLQSKNKNRILLCSGV